VAGKSGSRKKMRGMRAERVDYAVTVVPPAPPGEADAAFACWLAEHSGVSVPRPPRRLLRPTPDLSRDGR